MEPNDSLETKRAARPALELAGFVADTYPVRQPDLLHGDYVVTAAFILLQLRRGPLTRAELFHSLQPSVLKSGLFEQILRALFSASLIRDGSDDSLQLTLLARRYLELRPHRGYESAAETIRQRVRSALKDVDDNVVTAATLAALQAAYDRATVADDTGVDVQPTIAVAAERQVLGSMLLSKDAISNVIKILTSRDFTQSVHAAIYNAILELYVRGEPADPITVAAALADSGNLARVGGPRYLQLLVASVFSPAHGADYARKVARLSMAQGRRRVEGDNRQVQLSHETDRAGDVRTRARLYAWLGRVWGTLKGPRSGANRPTPQASNSVRFVDDATLDVDAIFNLLGPPPQWSAQGMTPNPRTPVGVS
ncbi:DnaB-like helicase N-terminal domain-containing protein [Micromonospora sp. L31]|uniref:DnaB-like helicase N-terminal domain-containing protein n=1 Tax=Micromonospora sp. L31 TaxID=3452213 RepID=UPI003F8CB459